jgi:hypothetical protein
VNASPSTTYTTTLNLRFGWSGGPGGTPATRPHVFVAFRYFDSAGNAVSGKASDVLRFVAENATNGFETFPLRYTTPPGTATVRIAIGAERNGLSTPITVDADNAR